TVFGGSLSETHAEKICKVMDLAMKTGAPIIGLNDSGGARIQEGVVSLGGYADIFYRNTMASGVIPQLSAIMGPCAGGAVYSPAITDFILMVEHNSYMFVTGPNVVKTVTHEEVSSEELGGAASHAVKSGVTHFACENEVECIQTLKKLLTYLPQNCEEQPPSLPYEGDHSEEIPELDRLVPENSNQPYDMCELISLLVDEGSFLEVHRDFAGNIITGFGRPGKVSASSPISPRCSPECWTSRPRGKPPVLSASAIPSISRCWFWWMYPDSFPGPTRNGTASSVTEPNCCTPSPRQPSRGSRELPGKLTAGHPV